jgi:hypothetical protein
METVKENLSLKDKISELENIIKVKEDYNI